MQIRRSITIQAPADRVWTILGPNYLRVQDWASSVNISRNRDAGRAPKGAPASGRVCETSIGPVQETILRYDETGRELAYAAQAEKMPFFVRQMVNNWKISAAGPDQCRVEMWLEVELSFPFNLLMGWMMRMQLNTVLTEAVDELKHFAETGRPHPRKEKAAAAFSAKQAAHA